MFESMSPNLEAIVLEDARRHALSIQCPKVHPEHILLGIVSRECVATKKLAAKAKPEKIIEALVVHMDKRFAEPTPAKDLPEKPPFSDDAKVVLDGAHDEAQRLGYSMIGTEHMLLAIVANCEPLRALLKDKFGITYGWLVEAIGPAPKEASAEPTGIPTGKKTVRVSTVMAGVFFDAGITERELELALIAIEQIKGVAITQIMQAPASRTPTIGG